jgi:HK97 family phage major capsid protein
MAFNIEESLKSINDTLTSSKKDFSDFSTKMDGQFKAQDARISNIETTLKEKLIKEHGDKEMSEDTWSWARVAYATVTKDWDIAPFERSEIQKWREKTMQAGTPAAGGSLIPPQYSAELITLLKAQLVLEKAGMRVMDGLKGSPVIIPKITSGLTTYWIAEGSGPTANDLGTGRLELQPRKCAALVKMSNDVRLLSMPSVEAAVRSDLVLALGEAVEKAVFAGTGLTGQPTGLDVWSPAINASTYSGADAGAAYKAWRDMQYQLELDNALTGKLAYVMSPASYYFMSGAASAVEKVPVFQQGFNTAWGTATPRQFGGYPVFTTTNCTPTATAYFANWDDVILAIWSQIDIAASDQTYTAFQNDELWIRAIIRCDVGIRREVSVCKMPSVIVVT